MFRKLNQRALSGFEHTPFILAFLFGVLLCGGLGVWVEAYKLVVNPPSSSLQALRGAVSTFFPALMGATSLQMAFDEPSKTSRGVAVSSAIVFLLAFIMMSDGNLPNVLAFPIGALASAAALWTWCVANGGSLSFRETPLEAPVGDLPLDAPLPGDDDLAELKH